MLHEFLAQTGTNPNTPFQGMLRTTTEVYPRLGIDHHADRSTGCHLTLADDQLIVSCCLGPMHVA